MTSGVVVSLVGMILTGLVAYCMGIRTERGRHARWAAIQEAERERRPRGGVRLSRIRVTRQ